MTSETADFFETLETAKVFICNLVVANHITGGDINFNVEIIEDISQEVDSIFDVGEELAGLTEDDLLDLGFGHPHSESELFMVPTWIFPLLPKGAKLYTQDGDEWIVGEDEFSLIRGQWVNGGFYLGENITEG